MLPVVDKPLIQYAVEEAYAAGVREMIFVTGRHKRPIEDHFDMTYELEVALSRQQAGTAGVVRSVKPDDMECIYVRQAQALGLGHAVLCGQRLVGNEPFAVLLADDLMVGEPHAASRWSSSSPSGGRRSWRCRKCRPSTPGATASWPARRSASADRRQPHRREAGARRRPVAPGRGRPLHPDARVFPRDRQPAARRGWRDPAHRRHRRLLRREKVFAYRYEGRRYDCGSKEGFLEANVELALAHPVLGRILDIQALNGSMKRGSWPRARSQSASA
jgi:UTP--glucose-1-phosphate uridylyltransferase